MLFKISELRLQGVHEGTKRMAEMTGRVSSDLSNDGSGTVVRELRRTLLELEGSDRPMELLWPIRNH